MRACIIGGGLAGSLLAWRLAQACRSGWLIDLMVGVGGQADATSASGGAVRAYEDDPQQRRLAIDSVAELLASPMLRQWSDYRQVGSTYVRRDSAGLLCAVADINAALPQSARLAPARELRDAGWAGLPPEATAVVERSAGYIWPARLRDAVLSDSALRRRVSVRHITVDSVTALGAATVGCVAAGEVRHYDLVIAATGPWTGALLRASGLPADGYRTKVIQYAIHPAEGWRPPAFVDETTGLFGRPTADGGLLLGQPTERWGVDPGAQRPSSALADQSAQLARDRFPGLRIGPARQLVGSTDCYCDPPVLSLRRAMDSDTPLFTFTGGSGGSVKTALAASQQAAVSLLESGQPTALTSNTPERGTL